MTQFTPRQLLEASVQLNQARDRLLACEPDLAEQDPKLWQDMLEGTADGDPYAAIDRFVARIQDAADMAETIRRHAEELEIRRARFQMREASLRNSLKALMTALEMKRFERPTYTATIGLGPVSVKLTVNDPRELEPRFQRLTVEANKTALREALENGEDGIGAALSNREPRLVIRRT